MGENLANHLFMFTFEDRKFVSVEEGGGKDMDKSLYVRVGVCKHP